MATDNLLATVVTSDPLPAGRLKQGIVKDELLDQPTAGELAAVLAAFDRQPEVDPYHCQHARCQKRKAR